MNETTSTAGPDERELRDYGKSPVFATTRWTVVIAAREGVPAGAEDALEFLCRTYWYPLYAYVRRLGYSTADAQDLTQEFFSRLLTKQWLTAADREKGRFRSFLIVVLKRFLANEWDRAHTEKRGGRAPHFSLDTELAEARYQAEPATEWTADRIYERRWALTLLEQTMTRLRAEFSAAGKEAEFEKLKVFLTATATISYADLGRDLEMSEGAARLAVHRMRKRFRDIFREEVSHTVASAEDVDEEMHHLLGAFVE